MKFFTNLAVALVTTMVATINIKIKSQTYMTNVLTKRQQALSTIACLEAKGDLSQLKIAINKGMADGVTVSEIKEALSQLYAYTGFPRSLNALGTLQAVIKERQTQGLSCLRGREATPLPADYDALKQGTKIQTKLSGSPFDYTFAPATDYYLKAHLFGDIFARDNLSFADRELVTVSALSGIKGVEPQLKAHIKGARNMGLSDEEIHALPSHLKQSVGKLEGYRASKAISEVYGKDFAEGAPIENAMYPVGTLNTAYAKYFIGNSYLLNVGKGDIPISNVTFEPRCRNNWHIHHKTGQILICVGGRGWYQEWGKQPVELTPGKIIEIPAEVKHWHGAARDSWMQHLAFSVLVEDASSEWLEPVDDETYDKLN